jgi:hypothetical protein
MNLAACIEPPPPSTLRALPRVDLFGPIHRAIRCALSELLVAMGATCLSDEAAVSHLLEQLDEALVLCEDHRGHEDGFVMSALAERLRGKLDSMERAHAGQPVIVAELKALATTLRTTGEAFRPVAGRTLYLHFSTFVADLFLHMAEEEQVVQPLLERSFTDDELRDVHARLLASLTPAQMERGGKWMMRAFQGGAR